MSLVDRLLDQLMKSEKYGERRGAAFGLAGVIKGFGISSLKKYGVATVLREGLANRFVYRSFILTKYYTLFFCNHNV